MLYLFFPLKAVLVGCDIMRRKRAKNVHSIKNLTMKLLRLSNTPVLSVSLVCCLLIAADLESPDPIL